MLVKKNLLRFDILLSALEQAMDAVVVIDDVSNVLFFNHRAESLWGFSRHEIIGRRLVLPGITLSDRDEGLHAEYVGKRRNVQIRRKDGQEIWVSLALSKIETTGKQYYMGTLNHAEIDEPAGEVYSIMKQSHFDPLTALPNRRYQYQHIDELLKSGKQQSIAIFFIDLVHFKDVNTTLGYAAGDAVLIKIARRFEEHLAKEAFISRSNSDSFVLVAADCDARRAVMLAEKIQALFRMPFDVSGFALDISASIGVSVYPEHGNDRDTLLRHANIATHSGRMPANGGHLFFSPDMNQVDQERQLLATALKSAIARKQLRLHYQPQIWLKDGRLYGVEALARWRDPILGDVSPAKFITLAEEIGEIEAIGRWSLREACRQMAEWRADAVPIPVVSVNLSPINFYNSNLPEFIAGLLKEYRLPAACLTVEITEGVMMNQRPETEKVICAVRDLGVGLSMDDFGTGYSSLSRLAHLPMTELKIDQSFMQDFQEGSKTKAIATTVVRIGQSLRQTVVAEGVETEMQKQQLQALQCNIAQGFLYSRALKAADLVAWVNGQW
ncbi:EAL domain-containing protein [Acerihabitans arboris]|uniref:EAL domain-containing protein n=1 Tax=Acerihabitans arboris TaxID=2691583 RepID=A0A845SK27_9GAMM|nr:EAL domain-containing protein [Acerihabitans arboris]NDL61685.1 EAL domain-containing protein [Acerihabitans arboris]